MKEFLVFAVTSILLAALPVHASIIDQSFLAPETGGARIGGASDLATTGAAQAQTFTAGLSGTFDSATIVLSPFASTTTSNGTTTDVTLSLWSVDGSGTPDSVLGTAFANTSILPTGVSNQVTYDFLSLGLSMMAGTEYALVATHGAGFGTSWRADPGGAGYSAGQRWTSNYDTGSGTFGAWAASSNWDMLFETRVSAVPVPAAVWLFGTALIGLVGFSKRKKPA